MSTDTPAAEAPIPIAEREPVSAHKIALRAANVEVISGLYVLLQKETWGRGKWAASHLRWMCEYLMNEIGRMPPDKSGRWIGFIQGVMAAHGVIDVDAERERTRPIYAKAYFTGDQPSAPTVRPEPAAPDVAALAEKLAMFFQRYLSNRGLVQRSDKYGSASLVEAGELAKELFVVLTPALAALTAERDAAVRATTDAALDVIAVSQELAEQINENGALTAALATAREREGKLREALEDARRMILTNLDAAQLRKCSEDFAHVQDALETK